MFPASVFEERRQLAKEIGTAPPDYLRDNAAALLRIIWELQASLALELQVIQGINRLDVAKKKVVSDYLKQFSDYVDQRDFDLERTSCGRIANIYWKQIRVLEGGPGSAFRVPELETLIQQFASADRKFTEEIKPFMDGAKETLTAICDATAAGNVDDARARQRQFIAEYQTEVKRLKSTINTMSDVGRSLLDRL